MKNNFPLTVCFCSMMFFLVSCASKGKQTVLPQQKQEVSAIYKECLQKKHGLMLKCIQEKVEKLNEDVQMFDYTLTRGKKADWQAPQAYMERKNVIPNNEENFIKGEIIFKSYCSGCHGLTGEGHASDLSFDKQVADLTRPELLKKTDGALFWKITEGGWPMPAFWEGDILSEKDIWILIQYLRTLSTNSHSLKEL